MAHGAGGRPGYDPAGRGGKIVATASIYGFVGGFAPSPGAHNAAKGGVVNLTRDRAPHGINITAIAPGFFRTNIGGGLLMDLENEMSQQFVTEMECRTPLGRMGDVKDLKGTAVFQARLGLPQRLHRRRGRRLAW